MTQESFLLFCFVFVFFSCCFCFCFYFCFCFCLCCVFFLFFVCFVLCFCFCFWFCFCFFLFSLHLDYTFRHRVECSLLRLFINKTYLIPYRYLFSMLESLIAYKNMLSSRNKVNHNSFSQQFT